jgi:hypothetical protein
MKTFEDNYNAWLEGRMTAEEAAAFERELEERPLSADQLAALEADEDGLARLFDDQLAEARAPKMGNEDFFNNQLLERIAEDEHAHAAPAQAAGAQPVCWRERISGFLGFLALRPIASTVAALAILLITGLGLFWKPGQPSNGASPYFVQFDNVSVQNNDIWAGSVDKAGATVLWVEGLDWIDGNEALLNERGV